MCYAADMHQVGSSNISKWILDISFEVFMYAVYNMQLSVSFRFLKCFGAGTVKRYSITERKRIPKMMIIQRKDQSMSFFLAGVWGIGFGVSALAG